MATRDTRNPYTILKVAKTADDEAIKAAYRKAVRTYHPDLPKNKGNAEAEKKFKDATWAKDLLLDPKERRNYDSGGRTSSKGRTTARPGTGNPFGGFGDNITDMFDNFGKDKDKEDAEKKKKKKKTGKKPDSSGDDNGESGQTDDGNRHIDFGPISGFDLEAGIEGLLDRFGLGGKNKDDKDEEEQNPGDNDPSTHDSGTGSPGSLNVSYPLKLTFLEAALGTKKIVEMGNRKVQIQVPEGVRDGSRLRVRGKGKSLDGETGDAMIEITLAPHSFFERDGDDIYLNLPIGLDEALLGKTIQVPTIRGSAQLAIPKGISGIEVLGLDGEGIKGGKQYVRLRIVLPGTADTTLEKAVKIWAQRQDFNPRPGLTP